MITAEPARPIPDLETEVLFTAGARKGCRGRVVRRCPRHGYFTVRLCYAPRSADHRKGDDVHAVPSQSFEVVR